jgi:type I restriction enzyme M protein
VIQPLIDSNPRLGRSDFPDFNDPNKLGEGRALVDRLTNLINIFNSPALDFSRNRADHDDILGDAYEYLMRHFAQESGKSKGQFYTPSEVSRIMARVIGVDSRTVTATTTAHEPTFGSGSLLLKMVAVVHEMIHLLEPVHSDRFITLLSQHCPAWQEARLELNELPVAGLSV